MTKYRVEYFESERGWGTDSWYTDYESEHEARVAYEDCHSKYMTKSTTPEYYIRPTYIGAVEV